MRKTEPVELTVLCLLQKDDQILLQDRKKNDWKGYVLPGGHIETGESVVDAVIREMQEETGLTIENPTLCGTKQFQTRKGERYVVFFYKADRYHGKLQSSEEGEVFWIDRKDLPHYPLAPDMMAMVEVMESPQLSEFYYYKEDGNWKFRLQ